MWLGYIREILGLDTSVARGYGSYVIPKSAGPLLASADYHGAMLEVVRSRCVSRVGLRGIVVKDTKFTFEMITKRNELKTVPKEHTIFRFRIPLADDVLMGEDEVEQGPMPTDKQPNSLVFELSGTAFESRAPERATKRVKLHLPPDP
jgi:ribonuclease P protein subunit POP4